MTTLPVIAIPPQPPADPPTDPAQVPLWRDRWENYRWAVDAVLRAEHTREQAKVSLALAAQLPPRAVGKAEVVLACIRAVPPTVRLTEAGWSSDLMQMADALWARMQADPVINPPAVRP